MLATDNKLNTKEDEEKITNNIDGRYSIFGILLIR